MITKEELEKKYNVLLAKREELVEAINKIDGALEAVASLYNEIEDDTKRSEPTCEIQGSDQKPDSKKKGN